MYLSSLCNIGSGPLRRFFLDAIPWTAGHEIRDISDAMHKTSVELVENARAAVMDSSSKRRDVMSILGLSHRSSTCALLDCVAVRANMSEENSANRLSMEEVIGQVS